MECSVEAIHNVIDASTLAAVTRPAEEISVRRHEVGEITLHTKKPIAFDVHAEIARDPAYFLENVDLPWDPWRRNQPMDPRQEMVNRSTSAAKPKTPVESGKVMCLSCHFAHGSQSYAMLRMPTYTSSQSALCQQCHRKGYNSAGAQFTYTHGGFNGNNANCIVCHSTHAKNNKKLLIESKEAYLCEDCHAGIGKFNDFNTFFETNTVQGIATQTMFNTGDPATPPFTTGGYDLAPAPSVETLSTPIFSLGTARNTCTLVPWAKAVRRSIRSSPWPGS